MTTPEFKIELHGNVIINWSREQEKPELGTRPVGYTPFYEKSFRKDARKAIMNALDLFKRMNENYRQYFTEQDQKLVKEALGTAYSYKSCVEAMIDPPVTA